MGTSGALGVWSPQGLRPPPAVIRAEVSILYHRAAHPEDRVMRMSQGHPRARAPQRQREAEGHAGANLSHPVTTVKQAWRLCAPRPRCESHDITQAEFPTWSFPPGRALKIGQTGPECVRFSRSEIAKRGGPLLTAPQTQGLRGRKYFQIPLHLTITEDGQNKNMITVPNVAGTTPPILVTKSIYTTLLRGLRIFVF